jgi:hypothetical protein
MFAHQPCGGCEEGRPRRASRKLASMVGLQADEGPIFVLIGALWKPKEAAGKGVQDFRSGLRALLPFYEAIILMGRALLIL